MLERDRDRERQRQKQRERDREREEDKIQIKSTLKLTRYSVSYRGPTLWNKILDKECVKLPMPAHQVLLFRGYL